jgi:hypothetical protein
MKPKQLRPSFVKTSRHVTLAGLAAALLFAGLNAAAATLSELLEQGIYSEETKGDLDGAIKIYHEIVADNKAGQTVAAQAQFRLAVCLHKKRDHIGATAAFEKLIKDYSDEKELVAAARQYLPAEPQLLPVPWTDGEEMRMVFKFQSGFVVGACSYAVNMAESNGRKAWSLCSRSFAGSQSVSRVEVDEETFKPIHSFWKHSMIGEADARYFPAAAELKVKGKDEAKKVNFEGTVYDNEQAIQLMRRLPYSEGFKTSLKFLVSLTGMVIPVELEVTRRETLEVQAGRFDCFKAQLSIGQTFWYSADAHRYLVKLEAGGAIAELAEVRQRKPGESAAFQDTKLGFSMTAPEDWIFFKREDPETKNKTQVMILDPEATALSRLAVETVDTLKPEAKQSSRAWAELEIEDFARQLRDFQVRADSWKERTIAGRAGVSFLAECTEGKGKQLIYATYVLGDPTCAVFVVKLDPQDFDMFKPKIDAVLDSYKNPTR